MREHKLFVFILACFTAITVAIGQDQNLEGIWKGTIPTSAGEIDLYWRIKHLAADSLLVIHDSPKYGVKDVPAPASWIKKGQIQLKVERFPATFFGRLTSDPDSIAGIYKGEGGGMPFSLRRISRDPSILLPYMVPRIETGGSMATSWEYSIPEGRVDDWNNGDANTAGLDIHLLEDLMRNALRELYPNLHSMLIARADTLIFEEYFYGYHADVPHPIYSNTKGIVSLGVGLAIDEGLMPDVTTPVKELFPEYSEAFVGEGRDDITLENLLTMTAGYEWDETSTSYYHPLNTNRQMMNSKDFVKFVLKRPLVFPPGEQFTYNSGLPVVLSELVHRGSGEQFWEYADQRIFAPLKFENYLYESNSDGTAGGLLLRPRDFLKIARLYLDSGRWEGDQLIPEGWLVRSTLPEWDKDCPPYWNHWGRSTFFVDGVPVTRYSGGGFGGQTIFGFPDLNLLVSFTAGNYSTPSVNYDDILSRYILPPLVAEGSGYTSPKRIPEAELEGYLYRETFFTGLACLWSAVGQLGQDVSEAWVYGMTGTAFALNANERMWPNCAGRWNNPDMSDHLGLLGFQLKTWEAYHLEPSFSEIRRQAWSGIRQEFDKGNPAWGFHMHLPENYIVYGYDDNGYYFRGVDCLGGFGPKAWEKVASDEPGWFEMHTLTSAAPARVEDAVLAALKYAVAMHNSPETFQQQGFVFGPNAYTQWQTTLSSGEADWMGIAYNAAAWFAARHNAALFLDEAGKYVPAKCHEALQMARGEFEIVARNWKDVSELFPYEGTERWERIANWQDAGKRVCACQLLLTASEAEARGVKLIEEVLLHWSDFLE
jgi:Beta-lactamase